MRPLTLERLEERDVPNAGPWFVQTFDETLPGRLPTGWLGHGDVSGFVATPQTGLSGGALHTQGNSVAQARVWAPIDLPADTQVSVDVLADSLIPVNLISRGRQLETQTPSYYAVSVTRGLQIQLLKVIDGQSTVLATLGSQGWLSGQWVRLSLTTLGNRLYVHVIRHDTGQYLNPAGHWQSTLTYAIEETDDALVSGGNAGLSRLASHAGAVRFDNFQTAPPPAELLRETLASESFSRPAPGGLPVGWVQWSQGGAAQMRVSTAKSLTESAGLRTVSSTTGAVRSWLQTEFPADNETAASLRFEGTATALLFTRGKNLDTSTPTYYAAAINGTQNLQLLRVVDGETSVISSIRVAQPLTSLWLRAHIETQGSQIRVALARHDTGQYLDSQGRWVNSPTWAITATDHAITGRGASGIGRDRSGQGMITFDNFAVTRSQAFDNPRVEVRSSFDDTASGTLPNGWVQWVVGQGSGFQTSAQQALSLPNSLSNSGGSDHEARLWVSHFNASDAQVSAAVYLDSLTPAQIIIRGRNLDTPTPSYYAARITRGLDLQLVRVIDGQMTVLSTMSSSTWDSNIWARVILTVQDDTLQVQVVRLDLGQYLDQDGDWKNEPSTALSVNDDSLRGGGTVGIIRPASYSGTLYFDDFHADSLQSSDGSALPDRPSDNGTPSTPTIDNPESVETPPLPTSLPLPMPDVESSVPLAPPTEVPPNPTHAGPNEPSPPTAPTISEPAISTSHLPNIPRHYPHIRIAQFAYHGTPIGTFERNLLRNSVDLVIPNVNYLSQISEIAPKTPQFIYSNASNIYRDLLVDWLNYADSKGYDREAAFYHVTQPTPFTGDSASSWPVVWFWNVAIGNEASWRRVTSQARHGGDELSFPKLGESLAIGNHEKFREINFDFIRGSAAGWRGVIEYATEVDEVGRPKSWAALPILTNTTSEFQRSGQILFDPPKNWVTASIDGVGPRLYYVRIRTISDGEAPIARTILGRDYVNARGRAEGVIPAFDKSADLDGDGYLNDAEYARRASGKDARFYYESRATYPAYGQNRFATNVSNPYFREWAADYAYRFLTQHPEATGIFMDNSISKIAFDPKSIEEPLARYADDYAAVLAAINERIAPRWVIANIAGGGIAVDALARRGISYLEEFAIRPMAASYSQFEDVAANLQRRLSLSNGKSFAIMDSLAVNGSMTDPRVQIGTLAYYYLLAHPEQTMLVFNGGNEPNTTWTRHWSPAVEYNVGRPLDSWKVWAQGLDPADKQKTFKVYQRRYENALILYKPLSYHRGVAGTTSDATATTHALDGMYRPLNADGTLGSPINRITLRNGEGAILVRA